MRKKDIIKQLIERIEGSITEENTKKYTEICDTLVDIFADALIENKKILWSGFLGVEVIERAARKGRNPQTNEIVMFPPTKVIKFKLSKKIKDMII